MHSEADPVVKAAKVKMARYCSSRERSPFQIKEKLLSYGLEDSQIEEVIDFLKQEQFLSEDRFAQAFARDKFRFNQWGRIKIEQELKRHQLSESCIENAIFSLDEDDYQGILSDLLMKKWNQTKNENHFLKRKKKTMDYLIRKGFESHLVWKTFDMSIEQH
jgi:regulatory protein